MSIYTKSLFTLTSTVPAIHAYRSIVQQGAAAVLRPIPTALFTMVAVAAMAKVAEHLGTRLFNLNSPARQPYKAYIIPGLWALSSFLTVKSQFPIRFFTAVALVITPGRALALGMLSGVLLSVCSKQGPDEQQAPVSDTNFRDQLDEAIDRVQIDPESVEPQDTLRIAEVKREDSSTLWKTNHALSMPAEDPSTLIEIEGVGSFPREMVIEVAQRFKDRCVAIDGGRVGVTCEQDRFRTWDVDEEEKTLIKRFVGELGRLVTLNPVQVQILIRALSEITRKPIIDLVHSRIQGSSNTELQFKCLSLQRINIKLRRAENQWIIEVVYYDSIVDKSTQTEVRKKVFVDHSLDMFTSEWKTTVQFYDMSPVGRA
jgi:hypothetical protein